MCSVARSLEVIGERWTLLILRDVLLGRERFDELVASTGVTRTVLARRLEHLVEHGVLERRRYQERPERFSYHATAKGEELAPLIALLTAWGDRHYPTPGGPPRLIRHRQCGGTIIARYICADCDRELAPGDIETVAGPGFAG